MSTWATVVPGVIRAPCRIVHMLSEQPQPTTRSAPRISSAASGEAKPPLTSRSHGLPRNSPLAAAEVASSAPQASASRSRSARAPECLAPRPAMKTGRCAAPIASASRAAEPGPSAWRSSAARGPGPVALRPAGVTLTWAARAAASRSAAGGGQSPAWTSSGRARITVRRSSTAVWYARTVSSTAKSGECSRAGTAPTALARPATSILKLDLTALAATSAASTISGVRLFAASVMPVIALVSPGP